MLNQVIFNDVFFHSLTILSFPVNQGFPLKVVDLNDQMLISQFSSNVVS